MRSFIDFPLIRLTDLFYIIMLNIFQKVNKGQWLLFILPFFLFGCEKDERDGTTCAQNCIVLSGVVVDTPANKLLSDVEIGISFQYYSSFLKPSISLGKTKTDTKGKYSFRFDASKYQSREGFFIVSVKKNGYYLNAYHPDSYQSVASYDLDELKYDTPTDERIILFKRGEMELRLKNVKKLDLKMLSVSYGPEKSNTGFSIAPVPHDLDTIVRITIPADMESVLKWQGYSGPNPLQFDKAATVNSEKGSFTRYQLDF